jgi:hypothetical protein
VVYYTSNNEFFKGTIESFPVTRFLLELTQHIPPVDLSIFDATDCMLRFGAPHGRSENGRIGPGAQPM